MQHHTKHVINLQIFRHIIEYPLTTIFSPYIIMLSKIMCNMSKNISAIMPHKLCVLLPYIRLAKISYVTLYTLQNSPPMKYSCTLRVYHLTSFLSSKNRLSKSERLLEIIMNILKILGNTAQRLCDAAFIAIRQNTLVITVHC